MPLVETSKLVVQHISWRNRYVTTSKDLTKSQILLEYFELVFTGIQLRLISFKPIAIRLSYGRKKSAFLFKHRVRVLLCMVSLVIWMWNLDNLSNNEREAEGSGNVVFEKDVENFMDGEKE